MRLIDRCEPVLRIKAPSRRARLIGLVVVGVAVVAFLVWVISLELPPPA